MLRYIHIPEYCSAAKKQQQPDIYYNMNESQTHSAKWNKLDSKDYIPHNSSCMPFWQGQNYGTKNRSVIAKDWE